MALRFLNNGYFAGKVGIGVEAPLTNLDILGTSDTYLTIRNTGTFKSGIRMYGGTAGISNIWHDDTESSPPGMHFGTSTNIATTPTTQLYIKGSDGNIGIGTTTPNAKLDIQGTQGQLFSVTDDLSGEIFVVSDISGVPIMTVNSSGVSYFDGNVGIGVTNPGRKLSVNGSIELTGSDMTLNTTSAAIRRGTAGQMFLDAPGDVTVTIDSNSNNTDRVFNVRKDTGSELFRIQENGNVGIGTTSPVAALNIGNNGNIRIDGNASGGGIYASSNGSNNTFSLTRQDGVNVGDLSISAYSGVGITGGRNSSPATSGYSFYVKSDGNVGIGTVSPGVKLVVADGPKATSGTLSNNSTLDIYGIAATSRTDDASVDMLRLHRAVTGDNKGSTFAVGLSYYADPGSNLPRTRVDFKTTEKAVDDSDASKTVMSLVDSGRVGIGTISPAAPLHVLDDSSANVLAKIRIQGDSTSGYGDIGMQSGYIRLFSNGSMCSAWTGGVQYNYINGSTASTLNSNGLGINTTTPDFRLDVDGTFGVSDLPFNTDSVSVLVADETIGAELITNGNFATDSDWSKGPGWTISGGTANAVSATSEPMAQTVSGFAAGNIYKVRFEVTAVTNGYIRVYAYVGASGTFTNIFNSTSLTTGVYEGIFEFGGTNKILRFYGSTGGAGGFAGSIDNVSVKQVTSASNQIQKRELGTGAFGPTPVGAYLPLAGGTMTGNTNHSDNVKDKYGTGNDFQIWHDGSNTFLSNEGEGHLNIINTGDDRDIIFKTDDGTGATTSYMVVDGSAEQTRFYKDTRHADGIVANFGNSDDLKIYHDGSNSYIKDNGIGDLRFMASNIKFYDNATAELMAQMIPNGAVELYYNNSKKFETTNTGVDVTGSVQIDSTLLSNQENTDIDSAAAEVVAEVAISYTAAFFDFVVKKGTNIRSGTVYACHDGTNVEFTETSTNDLGDTSDVTLSVDKTSTNLRLIATVTSDDWSVKSLIRAI